MTPAVAVARRGDSLVVALVVPLVLAAIAVARAGARAAARARDDRDPLGRGGRADGFAPAWSLPLMTVAIGLGLRARPRRSCRCGARARASAAPSLPAPGRGGLRHAALPADARSTWSLAMQRGLADAARCAVGRAALAGRVRRGGVVGAGARGSSSRRSRRARRRRRPPRRWRWPRASGPPGCARRRCRARGDRRDRRRDPASLAVARRRRRRSPAAMLVVAPRGARGRCSSCCSRRRGVFRVRVDDAGLQRASLARHPAFRVPLADVASVVGRATCSPLARVRRLRHPLGLDGRFGVVLRRRRGHRRSTAASGKRLRRHRRRRRDGRGARCRRSRTRASPP